MHQLWTKFALFIGLVAIGCTSGDPSGSERDVGVAGTAGTAGTGNSAGSEDSDGTGGRSPQASGSSGASQAGSSTGTAGAPQIAGGAGNGGRAVAAAGAPNTNGVAGTGNEGHAGAAGASASNAVDVTIELDDANAASATIPRAGGTVSTVASDGTELSLTIPPDALLSPELVTLTPLKAVEGLPFGGGLVAAAHFEPEGLVLLEAATLTITLPSARPASELIGFAYHAQGKDLHLSPLTVDDVTLSMPVLHFSGTGAASGSDADANSQTSRGSGSARDQATQAIANILRKAQDQGDEPTDEDLDAIADILDRWFHDSVMPNLQAAEGDDSILEAALTEMLMWCQNVLLLGLEDRFTDEWNDALSSARIGILNAIRRAHDRCISGPDASEVKTILRWGQTGLLLGIIEVEEFDDDVRACATFELDVSSHFDLLDDPAFHGTVQVSQMKLTLDGGLIMFEGSAASSYTDAQHDYECTISFVPQGDTASAQMTMNLNFKEDPDPKIQMHFWPGNPTETLTVQCDSDDTPKTQTSTYWFAGWLAGHLAEAEGDGILDWDFSGGSVFATKVYGGVVSAEGVDYQEMTRLDLYHTPE